MRRWYYDNENQISDWYDMVEGEEYFLEALHYIYAGKDQFSIAVEIEQTDVDVTGHHHAIKEVQKLTVDVTKVFDTVRFTITNMDDGYWTAVITNPDDEENLYVSDDCYGTPTSD
jgi:hypothetical protein